MAPCITRPPVLSQEPGAFEGEAYIEFAVVMRPRGGGREMTFRERSRFVRVGGGWLYASGDVASDGALLNR